MIAEASFLDVVIVVGGTILFWKLVGKPFSEWVSTITGVRFIRRDE